MLLLDDPTRLSESEALARSAVTLSGKNATAAKRLPYALDTLGLILQKQCRKAEALAAFEAALKAAPEESDLAREIQKHMESAHAP